MSDRKIIDQLLESHYSMNDLRVHVIAMHGEGWEFHSLVAWGDKIVSVMVKYE